MNEWTNIEKQKRERRERKKKKNVLKQLFMRHLFRGQLVEAVDAEGEGERIEVDAESTFVGLLVHVRIHLLHRQFCLRNSSM